MIYGRVYDRTVASAYYRAIRQVEGVPDQPANTDLLTLVDVLEAGALNQAQQEAAQALRVAIMALEAAPDSEQESTMAQNRIAPGFTKVDLIT